jgi:bifunctional ADP-heptose synthase (sugar kinase/adenylyltransferase)
MSTSSRRKFITDTGMAAMAGTAIFAAQQQPQRKDMKKVFIHHVYFWLKNAGNAADRDKLIEGLNKLSKVKTIKSFHIGKPADTHRDVIESSYAVSWCVFFDKDTEQASYQTDPIHLKFVEDYSALWQKVIVYDSVDI